MPEYGHYALIQVLHGDSMCHVEGMLILGPDGRCLHGCKLAQGFHDALILEEQDCISVLLETREGKAAVIVLERRLPGGVWPYTGGG